eukprot:TRINITY_DN8108_c0_g1_i2.p2 TRINITY_DN8108_c0_g1~~TRINITY_DN8108_c0_g1_i2.p2  ORF type:complete len:140 (-),score=8.50 TRINITY_DN8108_c0_g1_i2:71-490(-)
MYACQAEQTPSINHVVSKQAAIRRSRSGMLSRVHKRPQPRSPRAQANVTFDCAIRCLYACTAASGSASSSWAAFEPFEACGAAPPLRGDAVDVIMLSAFSTQPQRDTLSTLTPDSRRCAFIDCRSSLVMSGSTPQTSRR